MTDRELMQMALDALEKHVLEYETVEALRARLAQPDLMTPADVEQLARIEKLVDKIDPYEAQPEQKPVAWVETLENAQPHCVTDLKYCSVAQHERGEHLKYIPLYPAPSQREWQGLTIEERTDIRRRIQEYTPMDDHKYGEAVQFFTEDALKEKNT